MLTLRWKLKVNNLKEYFLVGAYPSQCLRTNTMYCSDFIFAFCAV